MGALLDVVAAGVVLGDAGSTASRSLLSLRCGVRARRRGLGQRCLTRWRTRVPSHGGVRACRDGRLGLAQSTSRRGGDRGQHGRTWTWTPDGVAGLGHRTDVVDGARATSQAELGVGVSKGLGEAPARRRGGFPGSRARAHGVLGAARSRARTRRGSTSRSARRRGRGRGAWRGGASARPARSETRTRRGSVLAVLAEDEARGRARGAAS